MATATQVRTERLKRKFAALNRVAGLARTEAAGNVAGVFVEVVVELTPNDTNRLDNGWIEAGNDAGVTSKPLLPFNKSSRHQEYLDRLEKEIKKTEASLSRFKGWMRRYEAEDLTNPVKKNGRRRKRRTSQPYYRKMKRLVAKFEKRLVKLNEAYESLASGGSPLVFLSGSRRRKYTTIRDTWYGGSGEVMRDGDRDLVLLTNHEPHGRFVERNWRLGHPVATAIKLTKPLGMRKISNRYLKHIRDADRAA